MTDTYKLQIHALSKIEKSKERIPIGQNNSDDDMDMGMMGGNEMSMAQQSSNENVRVHVDMMLENLLGIFVRLSLPKETEEDCFPMH